MKHFLLVLCGFFLLALSGCAASNKSLSFPNQSNIDASVKRTIIILDKHEDGNNDFDPICAGVFIGPNKILTAYHCIVPATLTPDQYKLLNGLASEGLINMEGRALQYASFKDYKPSAAEDKQISGAHKAVVIKADYLNDLALLVSDEQTDSWAEISPKEPYIGMPVFAVGHPVGMLYTFTYGTISSFPRNIEFFDKNVSNILQASALIWFGNSGGSMFDEDGRVMGIASRIVAKVPHLGLFISNKQINKFLSTAN